MPYQPIRPATGHLKIADRKRGGAVYLAKLRTPEGRSLTRKIGRVWTGRGRPPAGYFTDVTATQALGVIIAELNENADKPTTASDVTFGVALNGWLMAAERKVKPAT